MSRLNSCRCPALRQTDRACLLPECPDGHCAWSRPKSRAWPGPLPSRWPSTSWFTAATRPARSITCGKTCICPPGCMRLRFLTEAHHAEAEARRRRHRQDTPVDICQRQPRPSHRRAAQGRQVLLGQELPRRQSRAGQDHRHPQDRRQATRGRPRPRMSRARSSLPCSPPPPPQPPKETQPPPPEPPKEAQAEAKPKPAYTPGDLTLAKPSPRPARPRATPTKPSLPARAPLSKRWRSCSRASCPERR